MKLQICLYLIVIGVFLNFVLGAPTSKENVSESESVEDVIDDLENSTTPKMSRKGLYEILHRNQFFQDIFSEHMAPLKFQFGHVCENPTEWEQRFERKDFKNNHHQGKVLWGNINGNYGEHYWDLASGR